MINCFQFCFSFAFKFNSRLYNEVPVDYFCTLDANGEAVKVDPIKPTLKAPGTNPLKLQYDEPLSNFAFKFNLHRYTTGGGATWPSAPSCATAPWSSWRRRQGLTLVHFSAQLEPCLTPENTLHTLNTP